MHLWMNWNMAGNALGTTFSLLLLASIAPAIQGGQDGKVIHYEKVEAAVGQNITLPCIVKKHTGLKVVYMEWSKQKKENKRAYDELSVYGVPHGHHYFWSNVSMLIEKDDTKNILSGSRLHLRNVNKWDSGIYVCVIKIFPVGSIRAETQLTIEDEDDIQINCNVNSTVEVHDGENVTIRCSFFLNAQYWWTKDKEQVSESESLELLRVTDANAGVYKLTVNTGNKSLHKDFIITVLTTTTSSTTDLVTVSPQSFTKSTGSSLITSPTSGLSTHVERPMNSTNYPNTSNVTITSVELITFPTNATYTNVTQSTDTHSDPYHPLNSTPSSYGSTVFKATQEMGSDKGTESNQGTLQPEEYTTFGSIVQSSTLIVGTIVIITDNEDTTRSHVLVVLITFLVLILIAVVACFYRRQLIKKRMDQPPPFKPPPPPVKYTAARHSEVNTGKYPIARCNSGAEFMRYETIV